MDKYVSGVGTVHVIKKKTEKWFIHILQLKDEKIDKQLYSLSGLPAQLLSNKTQHIHTSFACIKRPSLKYN